jgi:hypothetical protein
VLLPAVVAELWRARATLTRSDPRLAALLWMVAVFLPHAFAASKRGVYLLPMYPAVALLIGCWMQNLWRGAEARIAARVLAVLSWATAGLLALLAIGAGAERIGFPLLQSAAALLDARSAADVSAVALRAAGADGTWLAAVLAAAALAALVAACAAGERRPGLGLAALAVCTIGVIGAVRWSILPAIAEEQTRTPLVADLRRLSGGADVGTSPTLDYGTLYYWGSALPVFSPEHGGPAPRYLLLPEGEWLHMTRTQRRGWSRVPGFRIEHGTNQGYLTVLQRSDAE